MKRLIHAMASAIILSLYCVSVNAQTPPQSAASKVRQELIKAASLSDAEYSKARDAVLGRIPKNDVAQELGNIAGARQEDAAVRYLAQAWRLRLEHADKISEWENALAEIVQLPSRTVIESRVGGDLHAILLRGDTPLALLTILESGSTTQPVRKQERQVVTTRSGTSDEANKVRKERLQRAYDADIALKYEYLTRYSSSALGEIIVERKKAAAEEKKADTPKKEDVLAYGVVAKDTIGAILAISKDSNAVIILRKWGLGYDDMRALAIRDLRVFVSAGRAEQTSLVSAIEAIEQLGGNSIKANEDSQAYAAAALMNIAEDESIVKAIRIRAIKSLGAIGGKEGERLLKSVVKYGTDDQIRAAAEVALKGLSSTSEPANDRERLNSDVHKDGRKR